MRCNECGCELNDQGEPITAAALSSAHPPALSLEMEERLKLIFDEAGKAIRTSSYLESIRKIEAWAYLDQPLASIPSSEPAGKEGKCNTE